MAYVVAYKRFSTKKQIEGSSEARQDDGFAKYLERNPKMVAWPETYWDKGASAYHGAHREAEFGRLLADCKAKKFPPETTIWVEHQNRFGRGKLYVVLGDWESIIGNEYRIQVGDTSFDSSTKQIDLIGLIVAAIQAHAESEHKGKLVKEARREMWKTGRTLRTKKRVRLMPRWISIDPDTGEYVLNDLAPVYRKAVKMAIDGFGVMEIVRQLDLGVGLATTFRQKCLMGVQEHKERTGKNSRRKVSESLLYPPLISEGTWAKLQLAISSRKLQRAPKKGGALTNLFNQMVDAVDGSKMVIWKTAPTKDREGICCLKSNQCRVRKGYHGLNYAIAEKLILTYLSEVKAKEILPRKESDNSKEIEELEGRIASIQLKAENLADETGSLFKAKLRALQTQHDALQKQLDEMKKEELANRPAAINETQSVIAALETMDGAELFEARTRLKMLIGSLVERIEATWAQADGHNVIWKLEIIFATGFRKTLWAKLDSKSRLLSDRAMWIVENKKKDFVVVPMVENLLSKRKKS